MYKLTNTDSVIRLRDMVYIPKDVANVDWCEYVNWVNAGNTPQPVDEPTPEELQAKINAESRAYLARTDWYVIRRQETGDPVPPEILESRRIARSRVIP